MKVEHLKLYCANLDELRFFYTKKFNFPIVEDAGDCLTLKVGNSLLSFEENRIHKSYYHFAINIPYSSVNKALKWAHKKVEVIHYENQAIQEFNAWEARAIFFLDPAGNVVEFIGRKRFNDDKLGSFNEEAFISISEVGIPVFEVSSAFKAINHATGIEKFDCVSNTFCAAGNDEGLLILVDSAEKSWFPTDDPARAFNLEVYFRVGARLFHLTYHEGELEIAEVSEREPASK